MGDRVRPISIPVPLARLDLTVLTSGIVRAGPMLLCLRAIGADIAGAGVNAEADGVFSTGLVSSIGGEDVRVGASFECPFSGELIDVLDVPMGLEALSPTNEIRLKKAGIWKPTLCRRPVDSIGATYSLASFSSARVLLISD